MRVLESLLEAQTLPNVLTTNLRICLLNENRQWC